MSTENHAEGRWGFLAGVHLLLSAFPHASIGQKAAVLAMSFFAVMFIGLGIVGSVALPAWAVVLMFITATLLIFTTAGLLIYIEREIAVRCRQIPIYPPTNQVLDDLKAGLEEIRQDMSDLIQAKAGQIGDNDIRANIFLLAKVQGGKADGEWRLVIHERLCVNMDHPHERQLQFSVGQGATGVAFRDGEYQFTRRQDSPKGNWDIKFKMTPELEAQVHRNLKWIITFPLLKPNTSEAVGVLNIDGIADVLDEDLLQKAAANVGEKVAVIAKNLSLQPSTCVGIDQLGGM